MKLSYEQLEKKLASAELLAAELTALIASFSHDKGCKKFLDEQYTFREASEILKERDIEKMIEGAVSYFNYFLLADTPKCIKDFINDNSK